MTTRIATKLDIKFGKPILMLSWRTIKRILRFTGILNVFCCFYCLGLFYAAVRTKLEIGDYLDMVTDNDGIVLPLLLGVSGLCCLPINIWLIFLLVACTSKRPRKKVNMFMFICAILLLFLFLLLFVVAIAALAHSDSIHGRVEDGILEAMEDYKSDPEKKYSVDVLQMQFQCCGSKNFTEWFEIPWFDTDLAGVDVLEEGTTRDDVPFSCCSIRSLYPCVHHDVMAVFGNSGYVYSPSVNMSISRRGCHKTLFRETQTVSVQVSLALFGFAAIQLIICITTRFIQTSHMELNMYNRNSYWHTAWLFGHYKGRKQERPPDVPPIPEELMD